MPIKPENKHRYPANWKFIRAEILARAGYRCEKCKAPHGKLIARGVDRDANTYMTEAAEVFDADTGAFIGRCRFSDFNVGKMVGIVLTIAHLDHTPENNDPENLRAWCQRCHLRYDAQHHAVNARETRRKRKNNLELFDEVSAC
jgi:5-methylcytosine-specific restriction endonuclease McrA